MLKGIVDQICERFLHKRFIKLGDNPLLWDINIKADVRIQNSGSDTGRIFLEKHIKFTGNQLRRPALHTFQR